MPKRNGFRTDHPGSEGGVGFEERDHGRASESMDELEREERGMLGQVIQRSPMSSVLTGFGLGFGFGLAVTLLISRRRQETWYERTMPETIHACLSGSNEFPKRSHHTCPSHGSTRDRRWTSNCDLHGSFYKRSRANSPGSLC